MPLTMVNLHRRAILVAALVSLVLVLGTMTAVYAGWWNNPVTVDSTGDVGQYTSLAVVDGSPAISYYDYTNGNLKYVRAANAAGSAWGSPVTLDNTGLVGRYTSLAVVDGYPAISYYDYTNGNLKYVRALDAAGSAWGSPVTVDSTGDVGEYTSLAVVDGSPAISYYDYTNGNLKYVRATNAAGSSWGSPVILDSTGIAGWYTSLAVVDGYPAISYLYITNYDLKYVRANDAAGSAWGDPITPDDSATFVGVHTSLAVVNGFPAISYLDITNHDLKYVRATNAAGSAWSDPITLDSAGDVGLYPSLAVVDSYPAISYRDASKGDLRYISYSLVPEITVLGNGAEIDDGATLPSLANHTDFGVVELGQPLTRTFTISNSGDLDLTLTGLPPVTITEPAALDFSLVVSPTTPVGPNQVTTFQVRFIPTAAGTRAATLTIANDDSDENPYDFAIQGTGNTAPLANAGSDQTVTPGVVVTLDGSASSDPDGHTPLTYGWTQTGGPSVTLSSASVVSPTFTAPTSAAVLTFSLVVTDSHGLPSLIPDEVAIEDTGNTAPLANAGSDQTVTPGVVVTLDGSGSSDPDGHTPLTYGWTQTGGPSVTLSSASVVSPTFTAPTSASVLTFSLVVTDSLGLPSLIPDEVVVTVNMNKIYLPLAIHN